MNTLGGIIGGLLGLLGGIIGTYLSIKNTQSLAEKSFMVRVSIVTWVLIIGFIALMFMLPSPYKYLLWIPYALAMAVGITYINKKISVLRQISSES